MKASEHDISVLMLIQEADITAINAEKKLENLPQHAQLQELAKKKQAVLEKQAQVTKMFDAARRKLMSVEDEQAILERKQEETQAKIDSAGGDFRAVQSLTRDLGGIAKRLTSLEGEVAAETAKYRQVSGVKKQVESAIATMDAQAFKIRDAYQHDAAILKSQIEEARAKSTELSKSVDSQLLQAYRDAARRAGGVGMARLVEDRCSTCRNHIDQNRMLQVKREAPVSTCPSCHRLLVIA